MTAEHDDLRWCWTEPHSRQAGSSVDATAGFRACPQQGTDFAPATSRAAQRRVDSLQPAPHWRSQIFIEPPFEWLSFAPEDRWRTLLTPAMKRKLRGGGLGFEPYRKGAKG
jgi:hypothetical protein